MLSEREQRILTDIAVKTTEQDGRFARRMWDGEQRLGQNVGMGFFRRRDGRPLLSRRMTLGISSFVALGALLIGGDVLYELGKSPALAATSSDTRKAPDIPNGVGPTLSRPGTTPIR